MSDRAAPAIIFCANDLIRKPDPSVKPVLDPFSYCIFASVGVMPKASGTKIGCRHIIWNQEHISEPRNQFTKRGKENVKCIATLWLT